MDSAGISTQISKIAPGALGRESLSTVSGRLRMVHARLGTRGLILLGVLAVAAIGYSNWGWLVAIGLAPIILGALPCAAMCAMGLCMMPKRNAPAPSAPANDQPAGNANNLSAAEAAPSALTTGKEKQSCC